MEAMGGFDEEEKEVDEETLTKFAPELASSMSKLIVKGRELFDLAPLSRNDDGAMVGVSSTNVMSILKDYLMFMSDVKKNTSDSQTSVESSAQDGLETVSQRSNGSVCTSTSEESNTEKAFL